MAAQGTRVVGVGIIGAGSIGRIHAANVAKNCPGAKLVAVADVADQAAK